MLYAQIFLYLQVLDFLTTLIGFKLGAAEMSPFVRYLLHFGPIAGAVGLRVGAVYERLKYQTPTGDLKRDFWGISATAPAGGGSIYAFWGHAGNGKGSAVDGTSIGGLTKGPDSASDQWEISYSYPLSLRTLLYAGYVRLNNRANAGYGFNINDYSTSVGAKPTGYVAGMVHFF